MHHALPIKYCQEHWNTNTKLSALPSPQWERARVRGQRTALHDLSFFKRTITYLVSTIIFTSCIIPEPPTPPGVQLNLEDPKCQAIIDFQDQRQTDSLLVYLGHEDPTYRFLAAQAFGSYMEPEAIDTLTSLLDDPFDLVREQAAYALGQQGNEDVTAALIQAFESGPEAYKYTRSNGAILEAVGKLGGQDELKLLSTIDHYLPTDTLLLNGQTRGIMQLGRREITSRTGTSVQLDLATDTELPMSTRVAAADYMARYPKRLTIEQIETLAEYFENEDVDPASRLLTKALAKFARKEQMTLLEELIDSDDPWTKIQLIGGLPKSSYEQFWPILRQLIVADPDHLARTAAAQWLLANGRESEATTYAKLAKDSLQGRERYLLYAAANRYLPYYLADYRTGLNYELQRLFEQSTDPYEQGQILLALGEFPWNYRIIHDYGFNSEEPVVRKAAAEAIRQIASFDRFDEFFGVSRRRVRTEISVYMREAITSGQVGMIYEAALAIKAEPDYYKPYYPELSWIPAAIDKLDLPSDLEAHTELSGALAALQGKKEDYVPIATEYNHPIDWSILTSAGKTPEVRIRTSKGNLTLLLFPYKAPGTVAAFLELVNDGFYDGLTIHRVAPGWVTQGGDPLGHGIGAGDFSIRTETPPIYYDQIGLVGAPRLGRDTESVQFFITHGPTPVLDGRYTIFGRVIEGLDVLQQLRIGDRIEGTELR
ncbi:MAG: peptidylprolyl isomerase [Bacteroidota bacterium]